MRQIIVNFLIAMGALLITALVLHVISEKIKKWKKRPKRTAAAPATAGATTTPPAAAQPAATAGANTAPAAVAPPAAAKAAGHGDSHKSGGWGKWILLLLLILGSTTWWYSQDIRKELVNQGFIEQSRNLEIGHNRIRLDKPGVWTQFYKFPVGSCNKVARTTAEIESSVDGIHGSGGDTLTHQYIRFKSSEKITVDIEIWQMTPGRGCAR